MMIPTIDLHAVRARQGGLDVYTFFVTGRELLAMAEIVRLSRGDDGLEGFQRPEIRAHVRGIAEYLEAGDVLFPNAIILAFAPGVRFSEKRGGKNATVDLASTGGVLSIPRRPGRKSAWIVDGQQRALALSQGPGADLPVPVVGFVSGDLMQHREQFILVNKAKPLDRRFIDELLPAVGTLLPRDLSVRRTPSALCDVLNDTPSSPFYQLIRRPSHTPVTAVITDSHIIGIARRSLIDPRGALAACVAPDGLADLERMFQIMTTFWSAVRDVFPQAWGLPPERSRLMHGAGLAAMGILMDQVMSRDGGEVSNAAAKAVLQQIAPSCRWTSGRWETLSRDWNDLQCMSRDIRALSNYLIGLERDAARREAA